MNEEYTFAGNIEEIYYREMRQYKRVLTKEEEQKYLGIIEKHRDYIKENNTNYDTIFQVYILKKKLLICLKTIKEINIVWKK